MLYGLKKQISAVLLMLVSLIVPQIGIAAEVTVDFARTPALSVVEARIIDSSEQELTIAGKFNRTHRWPTRGHLHVYSYSGKEVLIFESKHRLRRLNSKNRKHTRFHFKISIEDALEETNRIFSIGST